VPGELAAAGVALMKSAEAFVGPGCKLGGDEIELISIVPYDRCPTDAAMVAAYRRQLSAFDGLFAAWPPLGAPATFREKAAAFAEFTERALASQDTRGTAALYQDLAFAFNAWQPEHAVAVDPPRIVALYFGVAHSPSTDYFRNLRHDGEARKAAFEASGKHFLWRRGPNGFEGPYLEGEPRIVGGY